MDILFQAHSGLRYLVLVPAAIAFLLFLFGAIGRRPWTPGARGLLTGFLGVLDLQALLGLALIVGGRRPPGWEEHLAFTVGAVVVAHLAKVVHRRRADTTFVLPFAGVSVAIVLIVLGIRALGRAVL